jgi:hypothetical protein
MRKVNETKVMRNLKKEVMRNVNEKGEISRAHRAVHCLLLVQKPEAASRWRISAYHFDTPMSVGPWDTRGGCEVAYELSERTPNRWLIFAEHIQLY